MRLPNGFGSVYKLSGKRRKPYIARKTAGWEIVDGKEKQLYITVGYFATKAEGISALVEYNNNPYDVKSDITFADLYKKWLDRKKDKISASNLRAYNLAYKISEPLHLLRFVDIRTEHMQDVIDECGKGYDVLRKVKVLYNQLFDYAMEKDLVTKKYSDYVVLPKNEKKSERSPFANEEIQKLWDNIERLDYIDTVLIMIYTGLRPSELLGIETKNIYLDKRYMKGGMKTAAGKNRVIPINRKIEPIIKNYMQKNNEFLIANNNGESMSYFTYYDCKFKPIMEQLQMNHKPHDCRHTFATLMDNAGANKLSIKRIMGHASKDITDKVYTHKDIEELIKAIDLI